MSCDYPIKCKYWSEESKKKNGFGCVYNGENPPCEQHQSNIDREAEKDFWFAYKKGDKNEMECIRTSRFTNFGNNP